MSRLVKIPESALVSKAIRFLAIGFVLVLLGVFINKFLGFETVGGTISLVGGFVWLLGVLIGAFAVIKSWFS